MSFGGGGGGAGGGTTGGGSGMMGGGGGGGLGVYGMVIGGVLNILGGVSAGLTATKQIKTYKKQGEFAYQNALEEGGQILGKAAAESGASGFDTDSVSTQAVRMSDTEKAQINALSVRYEYLAAANRMKQARLQALFSSLNQSIQSQGGSSYDFSNLNQGGTRLGGYGSSGYGGGYEFYHGSIYGGSSTYSTYGNDPLGNA